MADITIPFPFGDLPLKPEQTGKIKVSDGMQQTLASVLGWDGSSRKLLRAALSGVLQTTSPQVQAIVHKTSTGPNEVVIFDSIPITEVMVMAHPSNAEKVWVSVGVTPTTANGWPLDNGDVLNISIDNLNKLKLLIVTSGNAAIIMYTR